jgi:transposase
MPRTTYTQEFRAHLVALVRTGRTPESLAREFEPSARTIRSWFEAAKLAETSGAVDKDSRISEVERELRQVEEEREILKKAAPWFAVESGSIRQRTERRRRRRRSDVGVVDARRHGHCGEGRSLCGTLAGRVEGTAARRTVDVARTECRSAPARGRRHSR